MTGDGGVTTADLEEILTPWEGGGKNKEGGRRGGGGRGEGREIKKEGGGEREGSMQGLLITCHAHVHVRGESGEPYEVILLPDPPLTLRAPLKEPLIFVSPSPTSSTSRLSTGMGFK